MQSGELLWPEKVTARAFGWPEDFFGILPLCRTISAAAGTGRRGRLTTMLVALLAAGAPRPAHCADSHAGWPHTSHCSRSSAGAIRQRNSVVGYGIQRQSGLRLRGRASVGRQRSRPLSAGSGCARMDMPATKEAVSVVIPALAQGRRQAGGRQSQRAGRDSGTAASCRAINRGHSRRRQTRPRPCRVAPGGSRQHLPSASGYRTVDRRFPGGSGRVFRTGATTIR